MQISPIVELRIIRALGDYLEALESSEPFSIECVKEITRRVFASPCPGLKETVHCYIVNHQKTLAEKIRAGDFTILVDPCDDQGEKSAAANQKENKNNLNRVNSPARKSRVLYRQAGRRARLLALARQQSNQRVNMNDSTMKAKTITPANAERNVKDEEKGGTIDLLELGKDSTHFSEVPSTNNRLSDSSSPQPRCSERFYSKSFSDDDKPLLGFGKHIIDNVPPKLEVFFTDYVILHDIYQPQPPALSPSSNGVREPSDKLDHNNINGNRLLLDASEIPKEEAFHTECMIPDEFSEPPPSALSPSNSGLTPFSQKMSHNSINGDSTLMTAFEIPKTEACHTEYMVPDTSLHSHHTVMNNATSQARKAQLYSELADLMQRNHLAEVEIARWEVVRLELRGQLRKKEHELKGLLQQEQREDS